MIEIKNLTKIYANGKKAVDNLTLSIESGDIYGFIGANGAGKTSTLKSIVGIHDFDSGEITIGGLSIKQSPLKCKQQIAYIPDTPDLYEHLTGYQFINFIADIYGVEIDERKNQIQKYGDMFEMLPNLHNIISSYSHGMKQHTALITEI